ncbi:hypothetical protein Droror1_Dr00027125 [Drosera rotundifolia]
MSRADTESSQQNNIQKSALATLHPPPIHQTPNHHTNHALSPLQSPFNTAPLIRRGHGGGAKPIHPDTPRPRFCAQNHQSKPPHPSTIFNHHTAVAGAAVFGSVVVSAISL